MNMKTALVKMCNPAMMCKSKIKVSTKMIEADSDADMFLL